MQFKPAAIALMFALSVPFVQAAETSPYVYREVAQAPANVKDREIAGLFDRWNSALQTGNVTSVVDLYAPGAVLQPTVSNQVRTTPDQIKDYFDHFLALKPVGQINYREIRQLGTNVAMDSGVYTFTLTDAKGQVSHVQARYTFVYEQVGASGKFLITTLRRCLRCRSSTLSSNDGRKKCLSLGGGRHFFVVVGRVPL